MCAFIDRAKCPGLFACGLRHRPPDTSRQAVTAFADSMLIAA